MTVVPGADQPRDELGRFGPTTSAESGVQLEEAPASPDQEPVPDAEQEPDPETEEPPVGLTEPEPSEQVEEPEEDFADQQVAPDAEQEPETDEPPVGLTEAELSADDEPPAHAVRLTDPENVSTEPPQIPGGPTPDPVAAGDPAGFGAAAAGRSRAPSPRGGMGGGKMGRGKDKDGKKHGMIATFVGKYMDFVKAIISR